MDQNELIPRMVDNWDATVDTFTQYRQNVGGDPYILSTQTVDTAVSGFQMNGYDVPSFNAKLRKGELLPQTPFERFAKSGSGTGSINYFTPAGHHIWATEWHDTSWKLYKYDLEPHIPDGIEKYVQESAAKVYGQGFDALTNIAELASVKRMFSSAARSIASLEFPRNWRSLTNKYLEYRYGWRILMKDILDLNEAIANLEDARVRHSQRSGDQWSFIEESEWVDELYLSNIRKKITDRFTVSVRGSVIADIAVPQFQFNPLQTAWEIIPYSFVVDWLLSVGSALQAISFMAYVRQYQASTGYRITCQRSFLSEVDKWNFEGYSGYNSQQGTCTAELSVRTPCSIPFTPRFSVKMNAWKVADLLALILQRIH